MVFRVFFAIAAFFNLNIDQINIKITFLYSFINQLVYIEILKDIETNPICEMVCKLLKALYSLKQSLAFRIRDLQFFF